MALWDTFLIDGVDVGNYARVVEVWDAARASGGHRGTNVVVPGMPGEVFRKKGRDVPAVAVGLALLAWDPATGAIAADEAGRVAQLNANFRALARMVSGRTDRPLTVTRRLSFPTGNEEHTAQAELAQPFSPSHLPGANGARLTLELRILDGVWYATTDRTASIHQADGAVTVTSNGDTTTRSITATFAGPATLANATLGESLTVTAACTVDMMELAPTAGSLAGLFRLAAGDNVISVTGGSVNLTWREAYL